LVLGERQVALMAILLEQRVTDLEDLMAQLLHTVDRVDRQVEQTSREMRVFEREMRVFEREMRDFKDEMRDFKDEMRDSKNEMNRKWGDLANKMGTMAEDLVAPSITRILRTVVGCPPDDIQSMAVRVRRQHPLERGRSREFDVVAACGEYVLINETKSRLDPQIIQDFAERMPHAREFFPEYADKKLIGAIASLYVDESLARQGEQLGLVVLGFGAGVMDVLNSPGFVPKTF